MAEILGREPHLRHPPAAQGTENLCARHVSLPQWGWAPRRPSRRLYGHRHRLPLSADARLQRDAPDGLGRLRPARRATCQADRGPSANDHGEEHRQFPPAIEDARLLLRLAARAGHDRRWILPLDAVHLPGAVRHLVRRGRAEGPPDRRAAHSRGSGPGRPTTRSPTTATSGGWPINWKRRSTGARPWAPCWPTRKSRAA